MPTLDDIPVVKVRPNDANPRLTFRQGELDELQESIRVYGVQVPIAVYKDRDSYILIDGERRWRCASKLNKSTIPALIHEKPSPLQNLLLMFNIHSLREQWDLLTIALKLPTVIELLGKDLQRRPTEQDISQKTGLGRGVIRRCKILIDLPQKYKEMLLEELKKPKTKQRLSEDLFIELERALISAEKAFPRLFVSRTYARDAIITKYQDGIIGNIVDLRKIAKIARAKKIGADPDVAATALKRLVSEKAFTIDEAFETSVAGFYSERDIASRIEALITRLSDIKSDELDDDVREKLEELAKRARQLLEEEP
jgi:ParB family transcriptional regulator, chromosome partitioning protein